ncbi:hypothetical protein VMCG_06169 [Cytospora schulzeri]|uniref:Uncharacterized protein n=1 Tax=Cytospora schulzeri TaxID=448051 RepID=A0A423W994_9PEZI|nr:hypothetical protein VMCG_06169 [Valsa malicola]
MASQYNNPPLPTHPGQQSNFPHQQQVHYDQQSPLQQTHTNTTKPPRSRGLSVHSDKSGNSNTKKDPGETHIEKERQRLHSKADPTMAMNEAEPSAIAAQSKNNLQNLRALQHKDLTGNVITDPDLSNPTRWREERPLATILAFEAAIDGGYRSSMVNSGDTESVMSGWNRRSSYYASGNTGRLHHESYYGSRPPSSFRPESNVPRSAHLDPQQGQNQWGPPQDRRRAPRMAPEPQYRARQNGGPSNGANVYAAGPNQRSYETVASGSGSSGEQAGYQTDPTSSDNSSIERRMDPARRQPEPVNDYGIGFSQAADYQAPAFSVAGQGAPQYGHGNGATTQESQTKPEAGDKRKSWFKRISKSGKNA